MCQPPLSIELPPLLADHVQRWADKAETSEAHRKLLPKVRDYATSVVADFGADDPIIRDVAKFLAHLYLHHHDIDGLG